MLVFSATSLPGPLKRLLPAPVVEVIALLSDSCPLLLPGPLRLQVLPTFFHWALLGTGLWHTHAAASILT